MADQKIQHPANRPPLERRAVEDMAGRTITATQLRAAVDGWLAGYAACERDHQKEFRSRYDLPPIEES